MARLVKSSLNEFVNKKKRFLKEVTQLEEEAAQALQTSKTKSYDQLEHELKSIKSSGKSYYPLPSSLNSPEFKSLCDKLLYWINERLLDQGIIVRDLKEDLCDGIILLKLLRVITCSDKEPENAEVSNSPRIAQDRLNRCIKILEKFVGNTLDPIINSEQIMKENQGAILKLLCTLVIKADASYQLPPNVSIKMGTVNVTGGGVSVEVDPKCVEEIHLTKSEPLKVQYHELASMENVVKPFIKQQMHKLSVELTNIVDDFSNGVNFIKLIGLLASYYVPLWNYTLKPTTDEQKKNNVALAMELMAAERIYFPKTDPMQIVNKDIIAINNLLFEIFHKYKPDSRCQNPNMQ